MINLDQRYLEYLKGHKKLRIDGLEETVKAYGWSCNGSSIIGYYVLTDHYKLYYNLKESLEKLEVRETI